MNTRLVVALVAVVVVLLLLLGSHMSVQLYSKIRKVDLCINSAQQLGSVMYEEPDMTATEILHMSSQQRFLHFRATRWISEKAFHRYLVSPDVSCNKSYRAGKQEDGGWDVCTVKPFLPTPPCLVYSFGIGYDFSFDDAIVQQFSCNVLSFDPSMDRVENHKRGKNIEFFKDGIAGRDYKDNNGWNLFSFATILKKNNHQIRIIDYLKIDVEWMEWGVIPDMAVKGLFKNIKQIGLEIHRPKNDLQSVQLINILEDNGFRKWKMNYNMNCGYKMDDGTETSQCIELYFINVNFLDKDSIGSFMSS